MRFKETPLAGAYVIEPESIDDDRGSFMRSFCAKEFGEHGLITAFVQCNISSNPRRATLRGMHYQKPPYEEGKLVRCTAGSIFDVIVDIRTGSRTYQEWYGLELTSQNRCAMYIPPGFAHGFQTLADDSEVFYQMTAYYHPGAGAGLNWDDPAIGIRWPLPDPILSERDAAYPMLAR
jgi:dTDP-4-dehydrorhamnose 3,5-epimerase